MYLTYRNKTTEAPISTNCGSPIEVVEEPSESEETFDEFEYKDKVLEEAKGFFTEEISPIIKSSGTSGKIIKHRHHSPKYGRTKGCPPPVIPGKGPFCS
ncbi:27613_t:CDS:2 [Gigaspora margarita]|uniref:27613_t:CDS:1 n=1 Tax=Gigaspora margarita TaxID=4874 RepID=A0ABM8W3D4_GIGMA|nr:27613_t:CDS:2 [Gigaspora margarita]